MEFPLVAAAAAPSICSTVHSLLPVGAGVKWSGIWHMAYGWGEAGQARKGRNPRRQQEASKEASKKAWKDESKEAS